MVLPELSRTMAYTTRNTVNRLARKELNSNPVVLELSKEKETYTSSSRNTSSMSKYDTCDKNLSTVLANSSNHSRARRHDIECK